MNASTDRGRRSARAGLVTAVLLVVAVGLVPAGAVRPGAAAELGTGDSAPPGRIVTAWGSNNNGQTQVPTGLRGVTAIAAGAYFNLALRSDGTVAAWGLDQDGQTRVPAGLTGVTAIAAGWGHSLALRVDGTVVA